MWAHILLEKMRQAPTLSSSRVELPFGAQCQPGIGNSTFIIFQLSKSIPGFSSLLPFFFPFSLPSFLSIYHLLSTYYVYFTISETGVEIDG